MANSDLPDVIHEHEINYDKATGHCQEDGDSIHFVDDGTVLFSHRDPDVISEKLTGHYSAIEDYMAANKLVINADKTHVMVMVLSLSYVLIIEQINTRDDVYRREREKFFICKSNIYHMTS